MSVSSLNTTELFEEFIDGDDIYNSIFEQFGLPVEDVGVPSFNCLGEVNVKEIQVNRASYFYSKYGPYDFPYKSNCGRSKAEKITLFGKTWDKGTCLFNYIDEMFKLASMELMILDESSLIHCGSLVPDSSDDNRRSYFQIRKDCIELCLFVNDFLSKLVHYQEFHWALQHMVGKVTKKLYSLRKQLGRITQLPDYIFNFCAHSAGNKCEEAGYHVAHCRFDLHWLDLHLASTLQQATRMNPVHLQQFYLPLLKEMFDLALLRFNKLDSRDLAKKSPFSCTCVQEMWLMLQIIIDTDSKSNSEKGFWSVFENLLLSFLKLRLTGESLHFSLDSSDLSHTSACLFGLWFTYNVGLLYKFNNREMLSCYPLLESIMKHLMSIDVNELEIRTCLGFIEKICLELWEPKTEPLLILWDYYQKRLNQLFYVPGQDLDSVATIGKSALSLLSQVKDRLEDPFTIKNSFEHFLRIVGLHLRRCAGSQNQRHWNLMTGRIYSKLPPPKLLSLNQTGEHHFVALFLTLASSADLNQVVNKYSDLCDAYSGSKGGLGVELLKGQLALCLLSVEKGLPITRLVPPLIKALVTSDVEKHRELFSITIDAFSDILDHHQSLFLGQHLFIDSWISRYLSSCSQTDSLKLLDVLLTLVVRMKKQVDVDPSCDMEILLERFWEQLGAYLMSSTSSHVILADIAANLASIYLSLSNPSRFSSLVSLFTNNQSSDVRLIQRFLIQLLDNPKDKDGLNNLDNLIIETWLRSNITVCDGDVSEMKSLSSVVANLPEIIRICGCNSKEILNSDDPLLEFLTAVHSKHQAASETEKLWIASKASSYFKDLDKWIKPILSLCPSAHHISKLYFSVGSTVSLISHLLYTKSKPNSPIQSVINVMLLPVSAHNSDVKMHNYILTAIRKTLHLFLQGLVNLGPASDPYIGRCVKELLIVYIPRCLSNTGPLPMQQHISSFSIVSLFNEFESSLTKIILDNIALSFFRPKARNPLPNCIYAIRFIKEILLIHSHSENVLVAISNNSIEQICDIIMFCDSKTSVYIMSKDVLKIFFENKLLQRSKVVSDAVEQLLSRLSISSLAWSARQLFDLFFLLSSYVPIILRRFLPKLLQHIKVIETKRGVSNDKMLRLGFERIQSKLSSLKE